MGAWVARKTSSWGTFSPSVRVILAILRLLASAFCFSTRESLNVGVMGLKKEAVGVGVGGVMRGSVG